METLEVQTMGSVTTVTMNRPDVRNAFNPRLIEELLQVFSKPPTRIMVLGGAGTVFSAGADLEWMKQSAELDETQNREEAKRLASVFQTIDECEAVVIARVQGAAIGGGMGLVSCCDVVVAESEAMFGFTEARLGLAPAVISPFVIRKIGLSAARRYFVTAQRFPAAEAMRIGLVHSVVDASELDETTAKMVKRVAIGGPNAVLASKRLVRDIEGLDREQAIEHTSALIAGLRASEEGQEGLAAFLEKRPARWIPNT
ncbi:MAG: enoyl-CoA hydratase-related protein [Myxococcota bacterium]